MEKGGGNRVGEGRQTAVEDCEFSRSLEVVY